MASWDFLPALEQSIEDYNSLAYPALADFPNPSKGHPALPFRKCLKYIQKQYMEVQFINDFSIIRYTK